MDFAIFFTLGYGDVDFFLDDFDGFFEIST